MKKKQLNAVMFLVIFLANCYGTVGKNFDRSDLKSIQNNVTSQEEIFERLGAPFKNGIEMVRPYGLTSLTNGMPLDLPTLKTWSSFSIKKIL